MEVRHHIETLGFFRFMENLMSIPAQGSQEQTISSREIAELTGKNHNHVMRDCKKLNGIYSENSRTQIWIGHYNDANNQKRPQFLLTKRQTLDLVMGYSLELRIAVTDRWEELEKQVQSQIPQTFSQALLLASQQAELIEQQQAKIQSDAPKVEFAETVTNTDDAIDMSEFAKTTHAELGLGRNKLFAWLRDNKFLQSGKYNKNEPYQRYIDNGVFKVIQQTYTVGSQDTVTTKTLVTGKGQMFILERIKKSLNK